jgi:hypothetical protein
MAEPQIHYTKTSDGVNIAYRAIESVQPIVCVSTPTMSGWCGVPRSSESRRSRLNALRLRAAATPRD